MDKNYLSFNDRRCQWLLPPRIAQYGHRSYQVTGYQYAHSDPIMNY